MQTELEQLTKFNGLQPEQELLNDSSIESHIYIDGGCVPNPGNGAAAIVVVKNNKVVYKETQYRTGTNNYRMELLGLIMASLHKAKYPHTKTTVFTDARYVVRGVNKGGYTKKNSDMWEWVSANLQKDISIIWVKGHAGNVYNLMADELCTETIKKNTI